MPKGNAQPGLAVVRGEPQGSTAKTHVETSATRHGHKVIHGQVSAGAGALSGVPAQKSADLTPGKARFEVKHTPSALSDVETVELLPRSVRQSGGSGAPRSTRVLISWNPAAARQKVRAGLRALRVGTFMETVAQRTGVSPEQLLLSLEQATHGVDATHPASGLSENEADTLASIGVSLEGPEGDPTGAAQVALGQAQLLRFADEALTSKEAAELLGVGASRVRQMVKDRDLWSLAEHEVRVPQWQIVNGKPVPGLRHLAEAARSLHPFTVSRFMERPSVDLLLEGQKVSPIDWLVSGGDPQRVADLLVGRALAG
jgi:hypothetical protein